MSSESLYPYYQRELNFMRQMAQEFARQYPAVAGRLGIEQNIAVDPHVERLIESFALLAGRVQHKLDDEFPELTDALLGVLYPHYTNPLPSMAVVQFVLDAARGDLPDGFLIDRHSKMKTRPVQNLECRYRTAYPVTLWPVGLRSARWVRPPFPPDLQPPDKCGGALRLEFVCQSALPFTALSLTKLRFFLNGDDALVTALYEMLFNQVQQIAFRPLDSPRTREPVIMRPNQTLLPVGFDRDDGLLPYPPGSFTGYRLLTEFFAYREKFLFFDMYGWRRLQETGCQRHAEVVLYMSQAEREVERQLELNVKADTFLQGCTPIINLFEQTAEPLEITQTKHEYPIVPDVNHQFGMEVFSVEDVHSIDPATGVTTEYQPFYSFKHGGSRDKQRVFWSTSRRASPIAEDRGTDVHLHLANIDFNPRSPSVSRAIVRTLCTNRDLPHWLKRAGENVIFDLESMAPLAQLRCVHPPSITLRPPLRRGLYWRLVSHLSLNHLSLSTPEEGKAALQEILRLYDFADPQLNPDLAAVSQQVIEGVLNVKVQQVVGRTGGPTASGFCRGAEVTVEFDEQKYVGTGLYLFASVLERFLGLYVSINSFSQLVARKSKGELKRWSPRAGEMPLL